MIYYIEYVESEDHWEITGHKEKDFTAVVDYYKVDSFNIQPEGWYHQVFIRGLPDFVQSFLTGRTLILAVIEEREFKND
jgi:hypothetical protein